jgi:hypothetical protein
MSIYAVGSAILDYSFVNIFCCEWTEAGHHRASPGRKERGSPACYKCGRQTENEDKQMEHHEMPPVRIPFRA